MSISSAPINQIHTLTPTTDEQRRRLAEASDVASAITLTDAQASVVVVSPGSLPLAVAAACGSHLDSVPQGGNLLSAFLDRPFDVSRRTFTCGAVAAIATALLPVPARATVPPKDEALVLARAALAPGDRGHREGESVGEAGQVGHLLVPEHLESLGHEGVVGALTQPETWPDYASETPRVRTASAGIARGDRSADGRGHVGAAQRQPGMAQPGGIRHPRQQRDLDVRARSHLLHGEEEPHHHGREKEIDQRRAKKEQERRGDQEGQKGARA